MAIPSQRLQELGIELPKPPSPLYSYIPTRTVPLGAGRALVYVSGQVPVEDGEIKFTGRVPDQVDAEYAKRAARLCALNILAQVDDAAGLDRVEQVAQVIGFVQSADNFGDQPSIINACSDLFVEVFGEAGRHTRAALGTNALPRNCTVEIAAVFVVKTG